MRATGRMTGLLLSLSFLFHSACSNANPTVTKTDSTFSTLASTTPIKAGGSVSGTTGATTTTGSSKTTTQAPTTAKSTPASTPAVATPATSKPTDKPTSTQTQASIVTNPSAHSTPISGATPTVSNGATTTAITLSQPKTTPIASTAATTAKATATASSSAVSSTTAALQTSSAPKTSGTPALVTQTGSVGTNKNVTSTDAHTTGPQFTTHTAITTSQDSNGGAYKTTVTETSTGQTVPWTTEPAVNAGTTSTHPTLTTAGTPTAETTNAGATSPQTTTTTTTTTTMSTAAATAAQPKTFSYSLNNGPEKEEEKDLAEVCKRLLVTLQDGNCTLKWQHHNDKIQFDYVEINGKVKTSLAAQYYEEITKKPTDNKTLIAILASCGALLIMIVILAVCASHRRKPYNENQHLTEELHTVENGYHDNPTLEVMEVQPEMQEKKMALNSEFNDSWIVPIDNLLKEDIADEEDTHL
ncbi:podocalyxin isoform X2 [Sander vitreus]